MIKINISQNFLVAKGHALFAEKGKDIVCAAISGIIFGGVAWFEPDKIEFTENKLVPSIALKLIDPTPNVTVAFSVITVQLKAIANSYPNHIVINEESYE